MQNNRKVYVNVGIMTIVSIAIFVTMLAVLGRWQFGKEGFYVDIQFTFLNNLSQGAPGRISGGIPVGYVEEIYQKDLKTFVRVSLQNELKNRLPAETTTFSIFTTGMMGQKYINITMPKVTKETSESKPGTEYIKNGDLVIGIDPPSIDQMLMTFSSWFDGKNGGQVLAEIMQETRRFIGNLNAIAVENRGDIRQTISQARVSFDSLTRQLDDLLAKLNLLSRNFSDISTRNKQDIQVMLENLSKVSRDLNLITQRINSGKGSVGKFVQDEEFYRNLTDAIANARDLFEILKDKPWMVMYKEN